MLDDKIILGFETSCDETAIAILKGEEMWAGQIQITATNRVITFNVKHSFKDPTNISDHEPPGMCFTTMNKHIVHNGQFFPIEWPQVVLWDDDSGLSCEPGT